MMTNKNEEYDLLSKLSTIEDIGTTKSRLVIIIAKNRTVLFEFFSSQSTVKDIITFVKVQNRINGYSGNFSLYKYPFDSNAEKLAENQNITKIDSKNPIILAIR